MGIIGLGYVGLPLAIHFGRKGFDVTGFDLDARKIDKLLHGESYIKHISSDSIKEMIDAGIITDAMFPKVEACITALDAGVSKAHIIDGRIPHSLLLEIYTDKGIGTQIIKSA